MQIVNYTTWIISLASAREDLYKVSIILLFVVNFYLALRLVLRANVVIWLILPVVICLSQRLIHACVSISIVQRNCEWLIKSVIIYLIIESYMDNRDKLQLIHAVRPGPRVVIISIKPFPQGMWWIIIIERIAWCAINHSSFCPISFGW